ncbi:tyrosine-type recombinase/integrase [Paralysiella testudinis]
MFISDRFNQPLKLKRISQKVWEAALKKSDIEDFRWHDLRHTWASWLVQNGVDIYILQELGGWESIEMVKKYGHLAPTHLLSHVSKIDL